MKILETQWIALMATGHVAGIFVGGTGAPSSSLRLIRYMKKTRKDRSKQNSVNRFWYSYEKNILVIALPSSSGFTKFGIGEGEKCIPLFCIINKVIQSRCIEISQDFLVTNKNLISGNLDRTWGCSSFKMGVVSLLWQSTRQSRS